MSRAPGAVVLMYHRLSSGPVDPSEGDYVVPPDSFEAQMRTLVDDRRPVVSIDDLLGGRLTGQSVALTFDDGCDTDLTVALPILTALGMSGAFFVNPGRLGQPGYLTWDGVRALKAAGMHVGSHGLDHTLLDGLSDQELERQLGESKRLLEAQLGTPVETLALPGGSGGDRAYRQARALGYRAVLGSQPGLARGGEPTSALPRWPVRQGTLGQFRATVKQGLAFRMKLAIRYRVLRSVRRVLGESGYARMRERWILRRHSARPHG